MTSLDCATLRILVVEDEPTIGNLCHRVLTREGFDVDIAVNGIAAHDMIERSQYDIFLIDIKTPQMTGTELYQWLKKDYPSLASHVIFTTGGVIDEDIMPFIEQSGRPFLAKPFTPTELLAVVRKTLAELEN